MRRLAFILVPLLTLACSAAGKTQGKGGTGGSGGNAGGTAGDTGIGGSGADTGLGGNLNGGAGGGTGGSVDCAAASTYVYVLSDANDLYSFEPDKRIFKKINPLACKTNMLPNSMAIDRNATAWVNYVGGDVFGDSAGVVYKVSTADASCEPQPAANMPDNWFRLGMGFSTDGQNTDAETFYVTGTGAASGSANGPGLGRINTATGALEPIGNFTGALKGQNAELTGTGDGRLFGFFVTTPIEVAEIDKATGAIKSTQKLPQVETPTAWAFSFWGGDFYLYTAPDESVNPGRTSNVTRYRPSDGSVDAKYMTNIGFRIVGAGVSTCAPLEPPK